MRASYASAWQDDLTRLRWSNGHGPLRQTRQAHPSPFPHLPVGGTASHITGVRRADAIHVRMSPGIGHVRGEAQHRLLAVEQLPIPGDLQHAPAAFDRVLLALVRWI